MRNTDCVSNITRFIYSGNIELKNLQGPDVLKLLIAVDELNIQSLISHIQECLIEHQTEFCQNPTGILETDVLPQDLIHDLLEFHIVPDMKPKTNLAPTRKQSLKFKLDSSLIES